MGKNTLFYVTSLFCLVLVLACGGDDDDPKIPDNPSADPPEITDVDPYEGEVGDDVDIIGANFSTTLSENLVKFGNVDAEVTNATATKLDVTVPDGAETAKITVTVNNQTATSENEFVVNDPSPKILSFTPMEGGPGTEVTITGIGLDANYDSDDYNVRFSGNGANPDVISVSDTELVVVVPGSLVTGPISIYLDGETIVSEDDFTLLSGRWTQLEDFGGPARYGAAMYARNQSLFIAMGTNHSLGGHRDDLWSYSLDSGNSFEAEMFPEGARTAGASFIIDDQFYYAGGIQVYDLWMYDPALNIWYQRANIGDAWRSNSVAFVIDGKGYVYGGRNGNAEYSNLMEYDPGTDSWVTLDGPDEVGRESAVGFSIGNKGYIGTGEKDGEFFNDFWEYDAEQDSWKKLADFPGGPRSSAVGFSIGDKGYIALGYGGDNYEEYYKDIWEYNPSTNKWAKKVDFAAEYGRIRASAISYNGKAYIGLGYYSSEDENIDEYYNDIWEFDPQNE
ncbi:Kelch repeat-containing protein [Flagellimonas sp.]|uniref:Kelch repeat-containing protein n=1 Tax=Flagellimonas sp. TaxID=2058762 RepID=UPI003BB0C574